MDGLFFIASKTLGMMARAETWLILALLLSLRATWRGQRMRALVWGGGFVLAPLLALTIWPLGDLLLAPLEGRFPNEPALTQVDGIIVLGGGERTSSTRRWGGLQQNEAGERMIAGAVLAQRFPNARLIFTGGEAGFTSDARTVDPSLIIAKAWGDLGIAPERLLLEQRSRNTTENARFTYELLRPTAGQRFVLVTSASHMPRAMQSFDAAGWQGLTAWPVDFVSGKLADGASWNLYDHLLGVDVALKEYLGLFVYRVLGR